MSKRKRTSKNEKWIKEGRGSGTGSEYKPWLKIQVSPCLILLPHAKKSVPTAK
ncbi:hypothetical protein MJG50_08340 [Fredinandcohnia sp. SECRCQ15]|uniref:Uncharacterized protein n=1 Tax=Fredinandcohnia quinoae TaxID=2918902 RepID=A0AAW5E5J7_9BACI|nr:hypothetical protein [Fredinandcohnia sp. SECRCQ15]MCH1625332.1 hypothetical protein [Fredinandcohnia sp. SECRCQ15]